MGPHNTRLVYKYSYDPQNFLMYIEGESHGGILMIEHTYFDNVIFLLIPRDIDENEKDLLLQSAELQPERPK